MLQICHAIQIKFNHLVEENVHMIINLPTKRISVIRVANIFNSFTHKMATETNLRRYGTKLRHCRPMYNTRDRYQNSEILSCEKHCLNETYIG